VVAKLEGVGQCGGRREVWIRAKKMTMGRKEYE